MQAFQQVRSVPSSMSHTPSNCAFNGAWEHKLFLHHNQVTILGAPQMVIQEVPDMMILIWLPVQVIRREGVRALWRGNGVTIVHRLPYSAVNFWYSSLANSALQIVQGPGMQAGKCPHAMPVNAVYRSEVLMQP